MFPDAAAAAAAAAFAAAAGVGFGVMVVPVAVNRLVSRGNKFTCQMRRTNSLCAKSTRTWHGNALQSLSQSVHATRNHKEVF